MEEIKKKLTDLVEALNAKELKVLETLKLADEKVTGLRIKEQDLIAREEALQAKEADLVAREGVLQKELLVERDRRDQLNAMEQQLNRDKDRIAKYLNI